MAAMAAPARATGVAAAPLPPVAVGAVRMELEMAEVSLITLLVGALVAWLAEVLSSSSSSTDGEGVGVAEPDWPRLTEPVAVAR